MDTQARTTIIEPLEGCLTGSVHVPGDKSISHRAVLFAAMAEGTTRLSGVLDSDDVRSSVRAVQQLGARVVLEKMADGSLAGGITGWGAQGPRTPDGPIDCGNSGTTARLLMGVLAPWDIEVELTGDESLRRRPMARVTAPLSRMGARFFPEGAATLPLTVRGTRSLRAAKYDSPIASAQVKTAVLLAGVGAEGTTCVTEPSPSRNHTELHAAAVRRADHGGVGRGAGVRPRTHACMRSRGSGRPFVGGVSRLCRGAQARKRHPDRRGFPQSCAHRFSAHARADGRRRVASRCLFVGQGAFRASFRCAIATTFTDARFLRKKSRRWSTRFLCFPWWPPMRAASRCFARWAKRA